MKTTRMMILAGIVGLTAVALSARGGDATAPSAPEGMAKVPAGCFEMGDAFDGGGEDKVGVPVHKVCLTKDIHVDIHEVTNAKFQSCVDAGKCEAPKVPQSMTREKYFGNPEYANHPVINVTWDQANAYCSWAGKRLLREAEWEYAARGGLAGKKYCTGDKLSCADANYGRWKGGSCEGHKKRPNDTHEVGSYAPNGYGLYDMNGNVWEWVNDWFSPTYYAESPGEDPSGPDQGDLRVVRGGGWGYDAVMGGDLFNLNIGYRGRYDQDLSNRDLGFRCAQD